MTQVLRWDVPKKVMTSDQWAKNYGFDGGPTGGYQPNMSQADQDAWKAKITGKKLGYPQVEIRKSGIVIIVNLGAGYNYKHYRAEDERYAGTYEDFIEKEAKRNFDRYNSYAHMKEFQTMEGARKDAKRTYPRTHFEKYKNPLKGINVHIACAGPIQLTFEEFAEMNQAIEEAKLALVSLEKGK